MTKAKKSATKSTRNTIDWKLFFKLVEHNATHEEIAKKMAIKLDPKSPDPLKPIRAMKSRAKTMGIKIDGHVQKLKVPKMKNAAAKVVAHA